MSLDIVVVNESGSVVKSLALDPDMHWEILKLADRHQLSLWVRMRDYYEDTEYNSTESKALLAEVEILRRNCSVPGLVNTLERVDSMIAFALERDYLISAISD